MPSGRAWFLGCRPFSRPLKDLSDSRAAFVFRDRSFSYRGITFANSEPSPECRPLGPIFRSQGELAGSVRWTVPSTPPTPTTQGHAVRAFPPNPKTCTTLAPPSAARRPSLPRSLQGWGGEPGRAARGMPVGALLGVGVFLGVTAWAYWPTLVMVGRKWGSDPQYSHGFLVPLFALYLWWKNRNALAFPPPSPSFWGVPCLLLGWGARFAGNYYYFDWLDSISILPVLFGGVLLLGGRQHFRQSRLAIGFLIFALPLPFRLETGLAYPLRRLAVSASTYVLQTLGRPAFAEGNVIVMNETRIGVVEACSGLGMLLLFFAMSTGLAVLSRHGLVRKALVVLSAAPIAVVVNVLRIATTAIICETAGDRWAKLFFHDLGGWLMMPLALFFLGLVHLTLARLVIAVPKDAGRRGIAPGGPAHRNTENR